MRIRVLLRWDEGWARAVLRHHLAGAELRLRSRSRRRGPHASPASEPRPRDQHSGEPARGKAKAERDRERERGELGGTMSWSAQPGTQRKSTGARPDAARGQGRGSSKTGCESARCYWRRTGATSGLQGVRHLHCTGTAASVPLTSYENFAGTSTALVMRCYFAGIPPTLVSVEAD